MYYVQKENGSDEFVLCKKCTSITIKDAYIKVIFDDGKAELSHGDPEEKASWPYNKSKTLRNIMELIKESKDTNTPIEEKDLEHIGLYR